MNDDQPMLLDDLDAIAADWFWQTDAAARLVLVEGRYEGSTGRRAADAIGRPWPGLDLTTDDAEALARCLSGRRPFGDVVVAHRHPDGRTRWFRFGGTPIRTGEGRSAGVRGVATDVTAQKEAEAAHLRDLEIRLAARTRELDMALAHMSHGLVMFDADHRVVLVNRQFLNLHDLSPDRVRPGISAEELIRERAAVGNFPGQDPVEVWRQVSKRITSRLPYRIDQRLSDGRTIAISCTPTPDGGFITVHEDVTASKEAEARITHMARHDALTGLANRTLLHEHLGEALARPGATTALLCLDLDRFKPVNDSLGHAIGDALLRQVSRRIEAIAARCGRPDSVLVARLGGDEMALVLPEADRASAATLAGSLIGSVGEPYALEGRQLRVGLSVGIAMGPADGADPAALLSSADLALYCAKREGGGTFRFAAPTPGIASAA